MMNNYNYRSPLLRGEEEPGDDWETILRRARGCYGHGPRSEPVDLESPSVELKLERSDGTTLTLLWFGDASSPSLDMALDVISMAANQGIDEPECCDPDCDEDEELEL